MWKIREPYTGNVTVRFFGFNSNAETLRLNGWIIDLVTNKFTGKKKLYFRYPEFRLCGRADYHVDKNTQCDIRYEHVVSLEFLTHERNRRFTHGTRLGKYVYDEHDALTSIDITKALEVIAHVQKEELSKMNIPKPQAEVFNIRDLRLVG